jgi:antitoxin (DNA-binding transcriptional repressor) of toxin-antitoxin stability system
MKAVGLRELKNRLSEYIRDVRRGESVLVTDRGEVVAELGPPGSRAASSDVPPGLQTLARGGLATLGAPNDRRAYRRLRPVLEPGRAAALLAAERGDR